MSTSTPTASATATAVPSATPSPSPSPRPTETPAATPTPRMVVVPFGSVVDDGELIATPMPQLLHPDVLAARYGDELYPSVEAMPVEVATYFTAIVAEISDFFAVREADVIAILRRQNDGGLRIYRERAEGEAVAGVARIPPRLWNGPANPVRDRYVTDPRFIEPYGGLGFDWRSRRGWLNWREGRSHPGDVIAVSADPDGFENSVAAVARYLAGLGLTRERAAEEPGAYRREFENALASFAREVNPGALPEAPADLAPVVAAFNSRMDGAFGVTLPAPEVAALLEASSAAEALRRGELGADDAAARLFDETVASYVAAGQTARRARLPLPWPFIYDEQGLAVQQLAARHLGRVLAPWELAALVKESRGDLAAVEEELAGREEARVFAEGRQLVETTLRRAERGQPLMISEVAALVQPALQGRPLDWLGSRERKVILTWVEHYMRRLPEFHEMYGDMIFEATPLAPMPSRILQPFGVPARYQPGGVHTGLDLRGARVNGGQQPPLFAVAAGTVVHVGPIYCNQPRACRGPHAVIIDHGNNVYTLYSHNSEATVEPGQAVTAGQQIGRQGNEGYSRGPHLHFEVHVGAPYTGNWQQPFVGGEFVDPLPWLPLADMT